MLEPPLPPLRRHQHGAGPEGRHELLLHRVRGCPMTNDWRKGAAYKLRATARRMLGERGEPGEGVPAAVVRAAGRPGDARTRPEFEPGGRRATRAWEGLS